MVEAGLNHGSHAWMSAAAATCQMIESHDDNDDDKKWRAHTNTSRLNAWLFLEAGETAGCLLTCLSLRTRHETLALHRHVAPTITAA